MTTHYHLLVTCTRADLSDGSESSTARNARAYNRRYGRKGHLFGDRFASWLVETEQHLRATRRYVLLNPVRVGLCTRAEDWPWSGSRFGRASTEARMLPP